jgi:hypothetical protein
METKEEEMESGGSVWLIDFDVLKTVLCTVHIEFEGNAKIQKKIPMAGPKFEKR